LLNDWREVLPIAETGETGAAVSTMADSPISSGKWFLNGSTGGSGTGTYGWSWCFSTYFSNEVMGHDLLLAARDQDWRVGKALQHRRLW